MAEVSRRSRAAWIGLACSLALIWSARAQDALYGKQPPPGSSFVRFVSALGEPVELVTNFVPAIRVGLPGVDRASPYGVVEHAAGRSLAVRAQAGGLRGDREFTVPPDAYVTILLRPAAAGQIDILPISDRMDFNQTRARLAFYNAAADCAVASLVLEPGGGAVFPAVASGSASSRTVNPVEARTRVRCGEVAGPTLDLRGLEIGTSYSIWLTGQGAGMNLTLSTDKLAPYRP